MGKKWCEIFNSLVLLTFVLIVSEGLSYITQTVKVFIQVLDVAK